MNTIAFDILGSDNGIVYAIRAAKKFLESNLDYSIILVGNREEIQKHITENERLSFVNSPIELPKNENIANLRKMECSMRTAINLVKEGKADAVVSAGNSAAYLTLTTLILKRIKGIKRSAFMPIFPTIKDGKQFLMLDVGANLEVTGEMLHEWAIIGSKFAEIIFQITDPKIGVLNVGTEVTKGFSWHADAHKLIGDDENLNYQGFVEARELLYGKTDVIVTDGYAGNMVLKSAEGTILSIVDSIRESMESKIIYKIAYLFTKGALKKGVGKLNHKKVGGAWIIGINNIAIKAHGNSKTEEFIGAFNQIKLAQKTNAVNLIKEQFQ